ncbi:MAG: sodium:panthothenate symporter [Lentisphaeria bacterium]|nr:sodium:panthothenate symporter [Lentisphaeria bacterium]
MSWIDWTIVVIPLLVVYALGIYSSRYANSVADFLSAGRLCGRYVIAVGDIANALSIIGLIAYIEVHYRTGFALEFWKQMTLPLGVFISLTGYCTYRFRETKAMSLGQFLEMRYGSRKMRVFAASLRSVSEIIANSIMPAVAGRFFIYFFNWPRTVEICGVEISTFAIVMLVCLFLAIYIICIGGTLACVVTDALQGMFMYPILFVFVIFVLCKFDWNQEIVPVMMDRVADESFLNPFDIENLRDFNVFFLIVTLWSTVFHRASWIGAAASTAARSPHESKMAGLLGTFRGALGMMFYVLLAAMVLTVLNHKNYAEVASDVRKNLSIQVSRDIIQSDKMRAKVEQNIAKLPLQRHEIGKDAPLREKDNLDTRHLDVVHKTLLEGDGSPITDKIEHEAQANKTFQQFRTLFNQQMIARSMHDFLPIGMVGLFILLMIMAMISTDNSRIYSAALTVAQDVVLPFFKKNLTPKQHIWLIRWVSIGVGVIFFFGSLFMAQLDYINLFVTITVSMWTGGCAPVMIFGLYSRFGTAAGAWTSLLAGMGLSLSNIFIQRNWSNIVYPFLQRHDWVDEAGNFLTAVSSPFHPWIEWEMNAMKCPINSYEFAFMTAQVTLILYIVVSKLTCKEPFNLDRMLHRGKYNVDGNNKAKEPWTLKTVFKKIIGITPEFTIGDKVIAWSFFGFSFIYHFLLTFVAVLVWNAFSPWPIEWWGHYFFVVQLLVPGIVAIISTFWFGIGGVVDMRRLFSDLKKRDVDHLDNGIVEGNVSLAEKARLEAIDAGEEPEM